MLYLLDKQVCGHSFCYECILSINDHEESPRCPLCRQKIYIQINDPLDNSFSWSNIGRITLGFLVGFLISYIFTTNSSFTQANLSAIVFSCYLFCYTILPMMQQCFQGNFNLAINE